MIVKIFFNKLYLKLVSLFLIIFLLIFNYSYADVIGEGGYRSNVEVNEYEDIKDRKKNTERCRKTKTLGCDRSNIKYEDLKVPKQVKKKQTVNPFGIFKNKKKEKYKTTQPKDYLWEKQEEESVKIGVMLPLSGKYFYVGQSFLDTMSIVINENKSKDIELIIKDTKSNPLVAKKAAHELIDKKVQIILGPFFSSTSNEVSKIAKYNKIPLISFSNDSKRKGQETYLMGFEPEMQIEKITEYAIKKDYKRFAAFLPNTEYGKRALYTYRNTLREHGIAIKKVELYDLKKKEYEKHIQNLVNLKKSPKIEKDPETGEDPLIDFDPGFDVLLVIESGGNLKHISALLTYYGVDLPKVKLVGTGEWFERDIGSEPGLVGSWFASPEPKLWNSFEKKFFNLFNYKPIRLSSLAYDSLTTAIKISENKETEKFNFKDFQNTYGFTGIDGKFRFNSDGSVQRNLAILEIGNRKFKTVRKPLTKFF